jgi:hypothetical protein
MVVNHDTDRHKQTNKHRNSTIFVITVSSSLPLLMVDCLLFYLHYRSRLLVYHTHYLYPSLHIVLIVYQAYMKLENDQFHYGHLRLVILMAVAARSCEERYT